jgi:hypothetical protein
MKKVLLLPVLFSVLFLGGCSGYYSQDQVSRLIQQQTAAGQSQIDSLKQQAVDLQNKVDELLQKIGTTTAVSLPPVANGQTAATSSTLAGKAIIDPVTKDWLTFSDDNLNYQLKYPKDFLAVGPIARTFACNANSFANLQLCPNISSVKFPDRFRNDDSLEKDFRTMTFDGHQFCERETDEMGMSQIDHNYYYISINGNKCSVLGMIVHTTNGCDVGAESNDPNDPWRVACEKNNNITVPQTLQKILSTISFK